MAESKKAEKELKRELDLMRQIEQVRNLSLSTEEKIDIILNKRSKKIAETKKDIAQQNEVLRQSVKQYEEMEKLLENAEQLELEREKTKQNILRAENLASSDIVEALKKRLELLDNLRNNGKQTLEDKKKEIEEQEKLLKKLELQQKLQSIHLKAQNEINDLGRSFVNDILNSQIAKTIQLTAIYNNIKEQLMSIVSANQDFARTTGMIASEIVNADSVKNLNAYGVSVADLTKTTGQLAVSMTSFTNQNKSVQDSLSVAASKFELLNISAAESGTTFNLLNKSLLVAGEDVGRTAEMMAKTAQGIGMAPAAMIKDFNAVMPQLAANGKKAFDVFYGLEKQAKSLGMAIGDLVGIAEGFDTFEGAAQKAGVLNSILGGNYLNSLELVQANEEERIELIKRGFDLSGRQFADMDRATQKSIAQALGFRNAGDAAAFLNSSTTDMRIEQMKTETSQAKLNDVMKEAADIGKQLNNIYNQTVVFLKPVIEGIKNVVIKFTEWNDASGGLLGTLVIAISILGTLALAFIPIALGALSAAANIAILGTSTAAAGSGIAGTITAVSTAVAGGITLIGNAAGNPKVAAGILVVAIALGILAVAIGLMAIGIGYGVKLAAEGMAQLVIAFGGLKENVGTVAVTLIVFLVVFALFVAGMIALALPGKLASLVLLAIGAGVTLIGTGVYLAATGMAKFVDSIKTLADKRSEISDAMDIFAEVGGAMVHMQNVNNVFVDMIRSLQSLTKEIYSFKTAMDSLPTGSSSTITANLKSVGDSIKLPEGNVIGFVQSMNSVAGVLNAASAITTEKVNISRDFMKEISTVSTNQTINNNTSKTTTPNIEVKVYLGNKEISKELAKEVKVLLDGKTAVSAMNGTP